MPGTAAPGTPVSQVLYEYFLGSSRLAGARATKYRDFAVTIGCTVTGGGHCWFGSPDCGTGGGAIGAAVVGANSTVLKDTDAVWEFFSHITKQ